MKTNPLFLVFFDHMSESNYLILLRMRFHDDFNFWWFSLMVCYWKYFFDFFLGENDDGTNYHSRYRDISFENDIGW